MSKIKVSDVPKPKPFSPSDVENLRKRFGITQGTLAQIMGIGVNTVKKWEENISLPKGAHLRLLNVIENHPHYFHLSER